MVNPDRNLYDPPYDDALMYDNEMEPERPRSRSLIVMLAFVVLAAFAGVVWVAYNQGVQQGARGLNPPMLTADAGPTRIAPDQSALAPGANPAPEKSYERLWSSTGERASGAENMMPGSEQPRSDQLTQPAPSAQDVASASGTTKSGAQSQSVPGTGGPLENAPPVDPRMDATVGMTGEVNSGSPTRLAMSELSLERPNRVTRAREEMITSTPAPAVVPSPVPPTGVSKPNAKLTAPGSTRPTAASIPATEVSASDELQQATSDPVAPVASSPTGGKVSIQLGSFPSGDLAASHWGKVKSLNQALLGAYSPQIVPANIPGKGTWFRLRVGGFSDKSSAKSVCDQLSVSGQACIIAGK